MAEVLDGDIYNDAIQILEILPDWNLEDITETLQSVLDVDNRVNHVIMQRLDSNGKRPIEDENVASNKKTKIEDSTIQQSKDGEIHSMDEIDLTTDLKTQNDVKNELNHVIDFSSTLDNSTTNSNNQSNLALNSNNLTALSSKLNNLIKLTTEEMLEELSTLLSPDLSKPSEVNNQPPVDEEIIKILSPIFPDACPQYLRQVCVGKINNPETIDELLTYLLTQDVPKRVVPVPVVVEVEEKLDEELQYNLMLEVFPDADPTYLKYHCHRLINSPEELKIFIAELLEHKNYPTLKEFKRKEMLSSQEKQYTTEFNAESFLEVIPDPETYFKDPKRVVSYNISEFTCHILDRFKNLFPRLRVANIQQILKKHNFHVIKSFHCLNKLQNFMRLPRKPCLVYPLVGEPNIPLLQELAYVTHVEEIKKYKSDEKVRRIEKFNSAKENGLLMECQCCFNSEVMDNDSSTCVEGHVFCNECIVKSVEIAIGENKTTFHCLTECKSEFPLVTLQKILKPKIFSKMALRKQLEEVKAAGIEDLESCPFCDFATIPAPGDKIFKCLNEDCMRESCRLCHEPSHIPFRCEEIEKPDEVKARVYIEDKMTEALLRKCWKCGMKFIKEDGCNKMTCSCGALMCYVCGKPVKDYSHFNGQGGTLNHLCPLYNDTVKLHLDAVRKIAEEAKNEVTQQNPDVKLKYDPLTGLPEAPKVDHVYKPGILYDPIQEERRRLEREALRREIGVPHIVVHNGVVRVLQGLQQARQRHHRPPPAATFIPPRP